MKKIIILFLLFTTANSYGQYFGEKITYLVKIQFFQHHQKTAAIDLELVSHDEERTVYNYGSKNSYVEIHNDSIFCNLGPGEKLFMFNTKLGVGDSIDLPDLKLKVDSIKEVNNRKYYYYRLSNIHNPTWMTNLIWIEGVGEILMGLDFFNQHLDGFSHIEDTVLAYCIDGQPYHMNGEVWEADDDCNFENSILGISKFKDTQKQFILSPNPGQGVFQITNNNAPIGVERITIYDLQGKIIFQENTSQYLTKKTIDLSEFPPSMYQLIIQRTDGMIEAHKIIKQ